VKLKRELGLLSTTLYGTGVIIGAGIYALIGVGAGMAGNMLWLAFLISAFIAIFSGLSYAELSSMFPKEAAEYTYTRKAFNRETLSFMVGWVLVVGTVIGASTVALGFGGYFSAVFGFEQKDAAACLILIMGILNYLGIKESAGFNNLASVLEIFGLLVVVAVVFLISGPAGTVDLFEMPKAGFAGIMAAVSVIFFAYIGFENVANLSEEVKDSRNVVPKALMLSLLISTVLYILVSVAAVREVGWEALSESGAPLTLVVSRAAGGYSAFLSFIALFSTANTVLIFLIVSSRILYGMAHGGSLAPIFSEIGSRGTPYFSVLLTTAVAALVAYATDIKTVAQLADLGVFIAYFFVNCSLIILSGSRSGHFRSPRLLGIPLFAYLGALSALAMMFFFEIRLWAMEIFVILGGFVLYYQHRLSRRVPRPEARISSQDR
jgi:APA family basic amino acid/polyamine antiporter